MGRDRVRGWRRGSLTPPARIPPSSARRPRRQRTPPCSRRLRPCILSFASGLRSRVVPRGCGACNAICRPIRQMEGGTTQIRGVVPPFCPLHTGNALNVPVASELQRRLMIEATREWSKESPERFEATVTAVGAWPLRCLSRLYNRSQRLVWKQRLSKSIATSSTSSRNSTDPRSRPCEN